MQQQGYFGVFMQTILLLHCFAGPALWLQPVIGCVLMLDRMVTLLSEKNFVRTHENMTDVFASIDPLHPTLLEPNKPLLNKCEGETSSAQTSGENEVF